jgi:hypothetical protein
LKYSILGTAAAASTHIIKVHTYKEEQEEIAAAAAADAEPGPVLTLT